MKRINRRNFIKKSSQTFAAGIIVSSFGQSFISRLSAQDKKNIHLEYRILGNTGLKVTTVGYGAMRTTDSAVLQLALDLGINLVDTAHGYQGGNNEVMVGKVLAKRRKEVVLCTKIKLDDKQSMTGWLEKSLKRLQTDYVDVLYLHGMSTNDDIQNEEAIKLFQKWKKEGKIRFGGFSTHKNETELLLQASKDKFWDVILVAYNFKKEKELTSAIHKAATAGIGIVGMKTQAGGYKTDAMGKLGPHQAALKWVLQNPHVHTTIPSMTTFAELEEDIQVMGQKMGWHDRKILDRYSNSIDNIYCRSCGACNATCPYGVDIPEVNRCLMYFEGYDDWHLARVNYRELLAEQNALLCGDCSSCSAICKYGLNLAERMPQTHQLLA